MVSLALRNNLRLMLRLSFGLVGAAACLLAAMVCEQAFAFSRKEAWLSAQGSPCLLFLPTPNRSHIAEVDDLSRRLVREGAHGGDVQISLMWDGPNDLDLWCVTPSGQAIYFGNRHCTSGGVLDIDMNNGRNVSLKPVEHIYWPEGSASRGTYRVLVEHFALHGGSESVPFDVEVQIGERSERFHETAAFRPHEGRNLLSLAVPVTAFTLQVGPLETANGLTPRTLRFVAPGFWQSLLITAAWSGFVALALAAGLSSAVSCFLYRRLAPRHIRWEALVQSAVLGFTAGSAGQILYALASGWLIVLPGFIARPLGFALLGGILACSVARSVPQLPRLPSAIVAMVVSLAVVLVQELSVSPMPKMVDRAVLAAIIGFAVGVLITFGGRALGTRFGQEEFLANPEVFAPNEAYPSRAGVAGVLRRLH